MKRQRIVVKTHFTLDHFTKQSFCGTKTRVGNVTSNYKEVTCGNCLRKLERR
jgi:hypothetical protein